MKIWVTSDQHFQNRNIWAKYSHDTRPFHSQGEHDAMMINAWNSVVSPEDIVFVLGDFVMGAADGVQPILNRLNGIIYLIKGNHDTDSKIEQYRHYPEKIIAIEDYNILYYKEKFIVMNHYPVEGDSGSKQNHLKNDGWQNATEFFGQNYDDCIYLYGHVHGHAPYGMKGHSYHVGVDTNNLTPVLLDDIVDMM